MHLPSSEDGGVRGHRGAASGRAASRPSGGAGASGSRGPTLPPPLARGVTRAPKKESPIKASLSAARQAHHHQGALILSGKPPPPPPGRGKVRAGKAATLASKMLC